MTTRQTTIEQAKFPEITTIVDEIMLEGCNLKNADEFCEALAYKLGPYFCLESGIGSHEIEIILSALIAVEALHEQDRDHFASRLQFAMWNHYIASRKEPQKPTNIALELERMLCETVANGMDLSKISQQIKTRKAIYRETLHTLKKSGELSQELYNDLINHIACSVPMEGEDMLRVYIQHCQQSDPLPGCSEKYVRAMAVPNPDREHFIAAMAERMSHWILFNKERLGAAPEENDPDKILRKVADQWDAERTRPIEAVRNETRSESLKQQALAKPAELFGIPVEQLEEVLTQAARQTFSMAKNQIPDQIIIQVLELSTSQLAAFAQKHGSTMNLRKAKRLLSLLVEKGILPEDAERDYQDSIREIYVEIRTQTDPQLSIREEYRDFIVKEICKGKTGQQILTALAGKTHGYRRNAQRLWGNKGDLEDIAYAYIDESYTGSQELAETLCDPEKFIADLTDEIQTHIFYGNTQTMCEELAREHGQLLQHYKNYIINTFWNGHVPYPAETPIDLARLIALLAWQLRVVDDNPPA
ncbi:hypothetical protein COV82_01180 [Candidatus Peregrinibacteria bacterium CG11_big_fil_rev_8_21_14_0_20_46_8]|nr:MAG: hypothetical protein COV82_01180 [Candidatus Peregrinibacteria bacterium CG11_big_fil_rev_8_21_14_0_20_46_8]